MSIATYIGCECLRINRKGYRYRTWQNCLVPGLTMLLPVFLFLFFAQSVQAQCIVACRSNLNISLGPSGDVTISPGFLLQDPDCDPNDFSVSINDQSGNAIGNVLNCTHVGQTMTARATHNGSGNYCETSILVEDNFAPSLTCRDTIVWCSSDATPSLTGYPAMSDNCGFPAIGDLVYSDQFIDLACYTSYMSDSVTSKIERTWTSTDINGNQSTCLQTIYLKRATVNDVEFPLHRNDFNAPALDCNDDPNDLSLAGQPTVDGQPIDVNGFCELVVTPSDQIVNGCSPGSYTILRTWSVVDWCNGDFVLNAQIIKLKDSTAPVVSCPPDITVYTNNDECGASVSLPTGTATDDCSGWTITPNWTYGSGYGPFTSVAPGIYTVTYTADDDCGNSADCQMTVTVLDYSPPVVVCDFNTQITLGGSNIVTIPAVIFDDGSYDNCGIDHFEVRRDTLPFGPFVQFTCEDVANNPISVSLKVIDSAGNENSCEVLVTVADANPPTISCPIDISLSCADDYQQTSLTGEPVVADNCGIDTIYFNDQTNLNSCGVGTVNRTWYVLDHSGLSSFCTQVISLIDTTPVEVYFPEDLSIYTCGAATFPVVTGTPTVINDDCESMWEAYTDEVYDFAPPACSKIFRTWEVIDWCVYVPNSGSTDGYWTHTQVISIFDLDAPEISCPADLTIDSYAIDCSGAYVTVDSVYATDCSSTITITNNSIFANENGADASGQYPIGTHLIIYTAEDGCGNTSTCQVQLNVLDAKAPSPICRAGVVVSISPTGTASISPELINLYSTDNCTDAANLQLDVSPKLFTCDDVGDQVVYLTVTDEAGNTAVCSSTVIVQDGLGYCPTANIGGLILTEDGQAIQDVEVNLIGEDTLTHRSDQDGYYLFKDRNKGEAYQVQAVKDTNAINGVSTFDILMITRHILGIQALNSPYKMIAADVNKSGSITTFDLVEMKKLILSIADTFSRNTSWRFVDANFAFENPANPFASSFPEIYTIDNLQNDEYSIDFVGVKIGDVNSSVDPNQLVAGESRGAEKEGADLLLKIPDQLLEAGALYHIPVGLSELNSLLGFQMSLRFDPQLLKIENINTEPLAQKLSFDQSNIGLHQLEEGRLSFSWHRALVDQGLSDELANSPLFYMQLSVSESLYLSEVLHFTHERIRPEAYRQHAKKAGIDHCDIRWQLYENELEIAPFALDQNYPNPFSDFTIIPMHIPTAGKVQLIFTDIQGRSLLMQEKYLEKGKQNWRIDRADLSLPAGLYYYQIQSAAGRSRVLKMIVL